MREHAASDLTDRELEHARRELTASLALSRPGSAIRAPIQAQLSAIDGELAERTQGASVVGLCSGGFATDDQEWLTCHLINHPRHRGKDLY